MRNMWESGPFIVYWNITNKCNFMCKHCHAIAGNARELSFEECISVVEILASAGVGNIIIAGGEPLLKDNIFEIVHKLYEHNIQCSIATNGYYITDDVAEKLAVERVKDVQISLDFYEESMHDSFRGVKGCYRDAFYAIEKCKKQGINVSVNTVLTPYGISTIDKLGDLLRLSGVNAWRVTINVPKGRGKSLYKELHIDEKELINKVYELKQKFPGIVIDDPLCVMFWGTDNNIAKQCSAGKIMCAIESDGSIKPCIFYENSFGNILNENFKEIWKKMDIVREYIPEYEECRECKEKEMCLGGCKAYASYFDKSKSVFCLKKMYRTSRTFIN